MKVFAISDLHLSTVAEKPMDVFGNKWQNYLEKISADWQSKVSDDDLVLLAGDFSWAMRMEDALPDFQLIEKLPGKKVILRGNHDYWWNTISQVRANIPEDFFAIQNDCLRFDDVLICGSRGWICPDDAQNIKAEDTKIYLREVERLELSLKAMEKMRQPSDKVVAMMHFPPFNGKYQPSDFVNLFVKYNVDTVVYGHLHGSDCRANLHLNKFQIDFYLTSCDMLDNKLMEIPLLETK